MAGKTRKLARSALGLAAASVAEVALQKLAENPRVRRKAKSVARSAKKILKRTGKKLTRAVKPRAKVKSGGKAKSGRRGTARKRKA